MGRRKALLVSGVGTAMVMGMILMAIALVHLSAQPGGLSSDRAAAELAKPIAPVDTALTPAPPDTVIQYEDVYESVPGAAGPGPAPTPGPVVADTGSAGGPTTPATAGASAATTSAAPVPASSPTTAPPRVTTTTAPGTTTTTRPPGVPADWPADKPIPPMPPGCQKPQLEDNGVWNCDH